MTWPALLPSNRTPWESAIEDTNAARFPMRAELVSSVWSAETCPVDLLPYLAWAMSVDVWEDSWPETTKREVIRKSLELHRLKTTLAGIKAHVALTGAKVTRAIRPPAKTFMRGAMTEEQRLAWLDSLPQIRIYPFATKATAASRTFFNGKGIRRQFYRGRDHVPEAIPLAADAAHALASLNTEAVAGAPLTGSAWMRASRGTRLRGRRATFYDHGVETPVTLTALEGGTIERITFTSHARKRAWLGAAFYGHAYATASTANGQVATVQSNDAGQTFAIEGGVTPVDVRPKRIAQARIAPCARMFFGRHSAGHFMRATHAPLLIYDRIALNDPTRLGARRKVRAWQGHGRFGIAPFTAELRISVPMRRTKRRAARWMGVGHLKAPDMAPLAKAIQAVRVSKAFRDTVLIDTANYGRVTFGGGLRFGDFTFGQIKEVD